MGRFRALVTVRKRTLPIIHARTDTGLRLYAGASGQFFEAVKDPAGNVWIKIASGRVYAVPLGSGEIQLRAGADLWVAAVFGGITYISLSI